MLVHKGGKIKKCGGECRDVTPTKFNVSKYQGRCEQRSEVLVKIQKKYIYIYIYFFFLGGGGDIFFFGGGGGGGGGGGSGRGGGEVRRGGRGSQGGC